MTLSPDAARLDGLSVPTDVREADQVAVALGATLDRFGRVDVLVDNAGGTF